MSTCKSAQKASISVDLMQSQQHAPSVATAAHSTLPLTYIMQIQLRHSNMLYCSHANQDTDTDL